MELRRKRSQCLKLMQKSGIDTTDWARINAFCQDPRIAGKVFAMLGLKDLEALQVKLRAIIHKGGLKPSPQTSRQALADESQMAVIVLPSTGTIN